MELLIEPEAPQLKKWADGSIRVGGTRLTLDSLLAAYKQGKTAEELAFSFPGVELADIHTAIAFYLRHQEMVDQYLKLEAKKDAEALKKIAANSPTQEIRQRLLARQAAAKKVR